jgi:hypothetical protein
MLVLELLKKALFCRKNFIFMDGTGNKIPITVADTIGNLSRPSDNLPGTDEYLVRVEWIKTVPLEKAIKEKGFFGNQNSAAKPRSKNLATHR